MPKHEIQKVDVTVIIKGDKMDGMRKRILELRDAVAKNYDEMCKLLHAVLTGETEDGTPIWSAWGFKTANDYCEVELGYHPRKAYYLSNIYKAIKSGPLPENAVKQIGWAKAAELGRLADKGVITTKNVNKWMKTAATKKQDELKAMAKLAVSKSKDKTDAKEETHVNAEEIYYFKVGLYREQHLAWNVALKKASAITGSDKVPHLVDCIAQAFNAEMVNTKDDMMRVMIRRFEHAYGIKIIALNDEESEVVYGKKLVDLVNATK